MRLAAAFVVCAAAYAAPLTPAQLPTTDGDTAVGNLSAQIDGQLAAGHLAQAIPLLTTRAQFLGRPDDYGQADALAQKLPRDADGWLARAHTAGALHRFTEAQKDLARAEKLGAHVEADRAGLWQALADEEKALPAFERMARVRGKLDDLGRLAVLYGQLGRVDEAERLFDEAPQRYRDVSPFPLAWLWFQEGLLEERNGRLSTARALYEAAHARLPQYAPAAGHLAAILAAQGEKPRAIALLKPLAEKLDDPEYAGQLAALTGDAPLRARAAARYRVLLAKYPLAYADHAARFFLGSDEALKLARKNWRNRPTADASALVMEAALAAHQPQLACKQAREKVRQSAAWRIAASKAYLACGRKQEAEALLGPPSKIDRRAVVTMFDRMASEGVDTSQPLLWGYSFIDANPDKLKQAAHDLEAAGYRFADLTRYDETDKTWLLHVERVERHDVDSLDARNRELSRFATDHGLQSYDGMDVGRTDGKGFPKRR